MAAEPYIEQTDLYVGGTEGYHTFRVPALIVTQRGTLLAFCEARRDDMSDTGHIAMVLRRSEDGGESWSDMQTVWEDEGNTCGNACPVVDRSTGTIWLLLTHNMGQDTERQIVSRESVGTRTVWVSKSEDDGLSWADPYEITGQAKRPEWTWYATGPGAGIQLKSGRLLIPCDHKSGESGFYSHVIYSDDHGETWRIGGVVPDSRVNECEAVELGDSRVLLNMRSYRTPTLRAVSTSGDEGMTWSQVSYDDTLIGPICQGSIRRFTTQEGSGRDCILFSNPASEETRKNVTVRVSYDECRTWPIAKRLHAGPSAYSCLAVLPGGMLACVYERGAELYYERITLARFNMEWLTAS